LRGEFPMWTLTTGGKTVVLAVTEAWPSGHPAPVGAPGDPLLGFSNRPVGRGSVVGG